MLNRFRTGTGRGSSWKMNWGLAKYPSCRCGADSRVSIAWWTIDWYSAVYISWASLSRRIGRHSQCHRSLGSKVKRFGFYFVKSKGFYSSFVTPLDCTLVVIRYYVLGHPSTLVWQRLDSYNCFRVAPVLCEFVVSVTSSIFGRFILRYISTRVFHMLHDQFNVEVLCGKATSSQCTITLTVLNIRKYLGNVTWRWFISLYLIRKYIISIWCT